MKGIVVKLFAGVLLAVLLIGAVPAQPAAAEETGTATVIHTVRWGETVADIATSYGVSVDEIEAANRLGEFGVRAGQQLVVPHVSSKNTLPHRVDSAPAYETVHVVQAGETLFLISVQYNVAMDKIIAANNILNPSQIYSGQRLIIPLPGDSSQPLTAPVQHIVQRGEILSRIANQYGVSMWSILQENNIGNSSLLYVGQVLTIPTGTAAAAGFTETVSNLDSEPQAQAEPQPAEVVEAQAAPQPAPAAAPIETTTYVIQPGDTLQKIALRYGTTVATLMQANQITNMNRIYWGQTLVVAGSALTEAVAQAEAQAAAAAASNPAPTTNAEGKLVLVDLSAQRAYAYENGTLLREFVVSTGLPGTPTVTGTFSIYVKYRAARMTGPGYDLPNVPYVMYFYSGYGLHGTYWHDNFGSPMSHGCVNFRTPDAEWIYNWAPVGTTVQVVA